MLTPEYLLHISEGGEEIAERIHQNALKQIIDRILLRMSRDDGYILTARDKWQLEVMQEAGYLLDDIRKEIAKATDLMESEIAEAMEEAGVKALSYDDEIYKSSGLSPTPLTQSPHLIRLMQATHNATFGEWRNFTGTFANAAQQSFIQAMDNAYTQVASGSMSYSEALVETVNGIVSDGVIVTYPSGHTDTIETATLRCIRTGVSQATGRIQTARMEEMGVDLVLVSSHMGARPEHALWQGKVYSRSGKDAKYPPFVDSTGYGTVAGLCGANCRHNFGPYFEGMENPFDDYDSEENQKAYETQQRQRTLERRIRKTKRECMALKEAVDKAPSEAMRQEFDRRYQRKAALLARQNAAYNDFCDANGLKRLSERLAIAKWDRGQAAKARAAAKSYAKDHPNAVVPKEYKPMEKKVEKIPEKKLTMQERMLNLDFKPAATIPEAEAYTDRFVEKYKSKYSGNVSFKGMDVEHANKVNRVLTAVYDVYDIPPHTDITVMNFRESKWKTAVDDGIAAAYQWGGNGGRLFINQKLIGTKKAADTFKKKGNNLLKTVLDGADTLLNKPGIRPAQKKYIEALVKSGKQVVAQSCDDFVEATIVHEMGHSLDSKVFRKHFKTSSNMDGLDIGVSMEKYAGGISGYAVSTKEEYIAESFASWWYGKTDVLDPDLIKIFEGTMKK